MVAYVQNFYNFWFMIMNDYDFDEFVYVLSEDAFTYVTAILGK